MSSSKVENMLHQFCKDIDEQGGVVQCDKGHWHLFTHPEWTNLAATYVKACEALNRNISTYPHMEDCPDE